GWKASIGGQKLPEPLVVNGGSNGWWLDPFTSSQEITLEFTPQKTLTLALATTLLFVFVCLLLVLCYRRDWRTTDNTAEELWTQNGWRATVGTYVIILAMSVALFPIITALSITGIVVAASMPRLRPIITILTVSVLVLAMTSSWWEIIATDPPLTFDWTSTTAASHTTIVGALGVLAAISVLPQRSAQPNRQHG
ncbi:MAG: hypothetical protein RIR69_198, partial [Actinomycetota bacterium]